MPIVYPFLFDRFSLQGYNAPEMDCGEGDPVYFPKNAWDSVGEALTLHDTLASGLEFLMDQNGIPADVTLLANVRCRFYNTYVAALMSELVFEGGRLSCKPECVEVTEIEGRIRKTMPAEGGTCPTGYKLEG